MVNGKYDSRRHTNSASSTSANATSSPPAAAAPTVVTVASASQPARRRLDGSPPGADEPCAPRVTCDPGHSPQPPDRSHANVGPATAAHKAAPSPPSAPTMLPKSRPLVDADVATAITNGESKQRSARTPRTQSDPSNSVKESAPAALLSSQSSSSSLNLPKSGCSSGYESPLGAIVGSADGSGASIPRSQSDLSNVGSTESGYSSLSLNNVPSPSVSPTRLSSSSSTSSSSSSCASGSASGSSNTLSGSMAADHHSSLVHQGIVTATPATVSPTSWSCAGIQCDIVTATTATSVAVATRHEPVSRFESEEAVECPHKSQMVPRIGATTSDAASQTDCLGTAAAGLAAAAEQAARRCSSAPAQHHHRGSSPICRHKSQEEIDCEQLCRDLISHLSSNDHLYTLLGT